MSTLSVFKGAPITQLPSYPIYPIFPLSLYTVPVRASRSGDFRGTPLFCPLKPYRNLIWALFSGGATPTPSAPQIHPEYTLDAPFIAPPVQFRVPSGWEN